MSNIRRYFAKGNIYFLTHVTYNRASILINHVDLLLDSIKINQNTYQFKIIAWVILPDHFHFLIDPLDCNLPGLMRKIKLSFSKKVRDTEGLKSGRIWQYRYWDHIIRDEVDLNRHIDYIHFNPVKHGIVHNPFEHAYSSIHEFYERGIYSRDWGMKQMVFSGDYGE